MLKRIIYFLVGIWLLSLGVALIILSNLGVASWDTVFIGLTNYLPVTVGISIIIVQIVLMILISIFTKTKPEYLSLITVILSGLALDSYLEFFLKNASFSGILAQYMALISGVVLLGFGISVYLQANFPKNQIDALMLVLHKKFNITLKRARLIGEGGALFVGFLLGGPIGVGTVVSALCIGPVIEISMKCWRIKK